MPDDLQNEAVQLKYHPIVRRLAIDTGLDEFSVKYVLNRLSKEGPTFLTKTLPVLSKAVLKGLEEGFFVRPTNFARHGRLSRVFAVWLDLIFDPMGQVLPDACPVALRNLRQFCEYFYKTSFSYSEKDLISASEKVISIENELSRDKLDRSWADSLRRLYENLFQSSTTKSVADVFTSARPRFGPGAFYGSESLSVGHASYKSLPDFQIGTTRADLRAYAGFFRPYVSCKAPIKFVEEQKTSRTLFVPKDSRGPRCISKEPLHLLRAQMGFFDLFSRYLEKTSSYRVNFESQDKNRELAYLGSISRDWATLDLKDASDRVRFDLALAVFRNCPPVRWFLLNARSTHTELPVRGEFRKLALKKVAGMGSGLTFPIMAVISYLSVIQSVHIRTRVPVKRIATCVYVYGDDVIVPANWYSFAVEGLMASGLRVNTEKSYVRSHFRESCGADYYKGCNVSPVRLKLSNAGLKSPREHYYSVSIASDSGLYQLDRHCRELVKNNLTSLADYYYRKLEMRFGASYGVTSGDSPTLGRYQLEPLGLGYEGREFTRIVPSGVSRHELGACPYKYLSQFFKSSEGDVRQPFQVIPVPRKIKLKERVVPGILLR